VVDFNHSIAMALDGLFLIEQESKGESVIAAWDEEIGRRVTDLDSGEVKPLSLEEARRRLSSAIE
jgi:hypothetical protein